jgi:glutamyl-Q tRNA(Asp) synthetase
VTSVVRGADLLDSTFRQIYLQDALGLRRPEYLHIPVVAGEDGEKLSKQTRAHPVRRETIGEALWTALEFLGHAPPEELRGCGAEELLSWAVPAWSVARVPRAEAARVGD